jgi:hypothetical protein
MCLPPSLLVERATIATQTDDPVIPILPLSIKFNYKVEVVIEKAKETWRINKGIQTDALREPILNVSVKNNHIESPKSSVLKRYLEEFNQEEFPRSNPKRVRTHDKTKATFSRQDSQKEKSILCLDPIPVTRDDGPVSEPFIDPSLGRVTKNKIRSLRMIAVIDHYEMKGMIKGIHITILRERFSKDFVSEEKYSLSGIRELLRSKGFGVDKYDRVIEFKK